ncbi:MAG: polysaccharide biosynthesis/export family protein [Rhizomicrobium sp.]
MMRYRLLAAVFASGFLLLPGCTFVPGMNFNGTVPESLSDYVGISGAESDDLGTGPEGYTVQRITPVLLAAEREIRLRQPVGDDNARLRGQIANYRYLVGSGDVLSIAAWTDIGETTAAIPSAMAPASPSPFSPLTGAGSISAADTAASVGFKVDSKGAIFYPYVGSLAVAGKTISEVRDEIASRAKSLLHDPQITVDVAQFNSQKYTVSGVVVRPGLYPLTDVPLTVSQAIAGAGGVIFLLPTAIQSGNTIPRPLGDLSHVLYTHDGQVVLLNIRARMEENDLSQDRIVSANDIIQVPDITFEQIHVIGEVITPGNYPLDDGKLNLAQALGDAGNMNLSTANFARILVFRGAYAERKIFWLDARSPDALLLADQFELQPQDVIYVASTDTAQWNRIIGQILPTVETMYETKVLLGK